MVWVRVEITGLSKLLSPPVPTISISSEEFSSTTSLAALRMPLAKPLTSSADSPFILKETNKAPANAGSTEPAARAVINSSD